MIFYWLFALFPATLSLHDLKLRRARPKNMGATWAAYLIVGTIFVGLRYEVGTDWPNYLRHYYAADGQRFVDAVLDIDPGYALLNWLSFQLGWGLFSVNLVCATVFFLGLAQFCRNQPFPWLALVVAIPYLVIVVAMGYTRQSVAISLVMFAMTSIASGGNTKAIIFVIAAALFHRSAVIMLPFIALSNSERRVMIAISTAALAATFFILFLSESVDNIYYRYAERQLGSQGAFVRILMNLLPAVILVCSASHLKLPDGERRLWWWIAVACIALVGLLYVSPSSTAVDRIALYFIPIQIVVLGRLPLFASQPKNALFIVAGVVIYSVSIMYIWLNFANNADSWLPYKNVIFELNPWG
ncbi:EpsG family protein [Mesorhizobium muleiense]|uniref:EpsG family protein n=1 Tax=Mesorhizobium muleiense TaxID=1004279 RepID=UPI001F269BEC|nr:EpsG family protein [Mesorhizobium muleiense]MCF6109015.1 EpsG family protein [Mesorhizobium muleiense]